MTTHRYETVICNDSDVSTIRQKLNVSVIKISRHNIEQYRLLLGAYASL